MTIKFRDKAKEKEVYIPPQADEFEDYEVEEELPTLTKEQQDLIELQKLLYEFDPEGAPLLSVLESWKARHKSLYISKISNSSDQYYLFTTIKRNDYKLLNSKGTFDDEEKGYEVLVEKCLLYPTVTQAWRLTSDAGVITTLGKQISYKSGFVGPQEALALIKII